MKKLLAALALTLSFGAAADTCVTVDGQTICRGDPEFFCDDAYTRICADPANIATCRCEFKNPPRPLFPPSLCEVRLTYVSTNPQGVLDATPANQVGMRCRRRRACDRHGFGETAGAAADALVSSSSSSNANARHAKATVWDSSMSVSHRPRSRKCRIAQSA